MNTQNIRPPEDLEAELALMSTMGAAGTLDPGSENADAHRAVLSAQSDYFIHPGHKALYNAIKALYAEGQEINNLSPKAKLEEQGNINWVGDFTGLVEILSGEWVGRPSVLADRLADLWRASEPSSWASRPTSSTRSFMRPGVPTRAPWGFRMGSASSRRCPVPLPRCPLGTRKNAGPAGFKGRLRSTSPVPLPHRFQIRPSNSAITINPKSTSKIAENGDLTTIEATWDPIDQRRCIWTIQ